MFDEKAAVKWSNDPRVLDLRHVGSLSEGVSRVLGHHNGALLLWGLKDLLPGAASGLAPHRGVLDLRGLEQLVASAAQGLAATRGYLNLSGLKSLSDPVAEALSGHSGVLDLSGLESLSTGAATAIIQHQGSVDLSGIRTLPLDVARALGGGQQTLVLSGLTGIDSAVIDSLMSTRKYIQLGNLGPIDRQLAEALRRYWGFGDEEGLGIWLPASATRDALPFEAAEVLRDCPWPPGADSLESGSLPKNEPLTVKQAIAAVSSGDRLAFHRIARMSRTDAIELTRFTDYLELFGLQELSEETAEILATIGDRINVDFPQGVTAEAIVCLWPYLHKYPGVPNEWPTFELAEEAVDATCQDRM